MFNLQKGDEPVVKPKEGQLCELFTAYYFSEADLDGEINVDYVSMSNLNEEKPLLSESEIENIYKVIRKIEKKINTYWKKDNSTKISRDCDIEFKLQGNNRELYIKQIRIFNN
mgnify:FL=1